MTKNKDTALMPIDHIAQSILILRGHRVLLDSELAALYGVTTKRFNEQVKRNLARFPADFMFQLTVEELAGLRSHFATSKPSRGGRRYAPYAFTEHGAIMAAMILNSPRAVEMSAYVVRAFVQLRELLTSNKELAKRLDDLEARIARQPHYPRSGDHRHHQDHPRTHEPAGAQAATDRIYRAGGEEEVIHRPESLSANTFMILTQQ